VLSRWPVVVVLLVLAGCDRFPAGARLGLESSQTGPVKILYAACPGEVISAVELVIPVDHPGGDDDRIIWAVRNAGGRTGAIQLVAGAPPPSGYETSVPLRQVPPDQELSVIVDSDKANVVSSFGPGDLRPDTFLTNANEYVSSSDFEQSAADSCNNR
jgi:hypothetical protein